MCEDQCELSSSSKHHESIRAKQQQTATIGIRIANCSRSSRSVFASPSMPVEASAIACDFMHSWLLERSSTRAHAAIHLNDAVASPYMACILTVFIRFMPLLNTDTLTPVQNNRRHHEDPPLKRRREASQLAECQQRCMVYLPTCAWSNAEIRVLQVCSTLESSASGQHCKVYLALAVYSHRVQVATWQHVCGSCNVPFGSQKPPPVATAATLHQNAAKRLQATSDTV